MVGKKKIAEMLISTFVLISFFNGLSSFHRCWTTLGLWAWKLFRKPYNLLFLQIWLRKIHIHSWNKKGM